MLYIAIASYILKNEAQFFYNQEELVADYQYDLRQNFQELKIPINDQLELHALWIKNEVNRGYILYFPGSEYLSGELNESQKYYYSLGYHLIIPDYRGTGKSNGKYNLEEELYQDAAQWLKLSRSLADTIPLLMVGQGFGSGIAAQAYRNSSAQLLILEKPYYAWNNVMLRKYFWWLPHTYFTSFKVPTWEYIRASSQPIVLIHPTESKDIKFKNSELLLDYLKPGDRLISLPGDKIDYKSRAFLEYFDKVKLP